MKSTDSASSLEGLQPAGAASPARAATSRGTAAVALLLLVPAPLIGVWFGFASETTRGTPAGQAIFALAKTWLLLLPVVWHFLVDKGRPGWSRPRQGGFGFGAATGFAIGLFIVLAWLIIGRSWIDPEKMRATVQAAGIGSPRAFALFALYTCTVNAVLEEYVWRWFVYRKCETILGGGAAAVILSAAFFTLHHVVALLAQLPMSAALLASLGVFIGGCVWSAMYLKFRSIWPGFFSHALVDIAIFLVGGWILFFA